MDPPPPEPRARRDADALVPEVYRDLHAAAVRLLDAQHGPLTLQPTALVHEAYLRLGRPESPVEFESPLHFYRSAAIAMRHVLVNHARDRARLKRGGAHRRVTLSGLDVDGGPGLDLDDLLTLDEALAELAERDPELTELVELRFFAGLTTDDAAQALGVSTPTAERRWRVARAFLRGRMRADEDTP